MEMPGRIARRTMSAAAFGVMAATAMYGRPTDGFRGRLVGAVMATASVCATPHPLGPLLAPLARSVADVCPAAVVESCRPLSVDVESFRSAFAPTGVPVTPEALSAGLGFEVRDVPTREAYRCAEGQPLHDCDLVEARTHLRVEAAPLRGDTLVVEALLSWAGGPRPGPSGGFSVIRYVYVRENGRWVYHSRRPRIVT